MFTWSAGKQAHQRRNLSLELAGITFCLSPDALHLNCVYGTFADHCGRRASRGELLLQSVDFRAKLALDLRMRPKRVDC